MVALHGSPREAVAARYGSLWLARNEPTVNVGPVRVGTSGTPGHCHTTSLSRRSRRLVMSFVFLIASSTTSM